MKTCTSCGRVIADDDGLELTDGSFYCKSGGCQKKLLDGVFEKEVVPDIIHSGGRVVKFVDQERPAQKSAIPVLDDEPTELNHECEFCHKVQVDGSRYCFYYGKKTDTSFFDTLLSLRGISSPPLIKDRGSAWICQKCTNLHKTQRRIILVSLLLIEVLLLAAGFLQTPLGLFLLALGILLLGILIIILPRMGGEKEIPERLAIRIKKKELRQKGFNVFLTNKQFAKLH
jgi:hypothetical protein